MSDRDTSAAASPSVEPRHARRAALAGLLAAMAMAGPAFAQTSIGQPPFGRQPDAIDQARQRALAPIPRAPLPAAPAQIWVPERRLFSPELGRQIVVPGHYEGRISGQQSQVPPITVYGPQGQNPVLIPGGERPPADVRQGP